MRSAGFDAARASVGVAGGERSPCGACGPALCGRSLSGAAQQVVYRQVTVPFEEEDWRSRGGSARTRWTGCRAGGSRPAGTESGFDRLASAVAAGASDPARGRSPLADLDPSPHLCGRLELGAAGCGGAAACERRRAAGGAGQLSRLHRLAAGSRSRGRRRHSGAMRWQGSRRRRCLADALATNNKANEAAGQASIALAVNAELTERLKSFAKRERVTLNTLVQGGVGAVVAAAFGAGGRLFRGDRIGPAGGIAWLRGDGGPVHQHVTDVVDASNPQARCRRLAASVAGPEPGFARAWLDAALRDPATRRACPGRPLFDSILVFENYPIDQALRRTESEGPALGARWNM